MHLLTFTDLCEGCLVWERECVCRTYDRSRSKTEVSEWFYFPDYMSLSLKARLYTR